MAKLPLKHPLTFGKKTIDSLTFRDHTTAGDYLAFDQRGGVAQRIALIASLTGTDESVIRQLRGPDRGRPHRGVHLRGHRACRRDPGRGDRHHLRTRRLVRGH